MPQCIIIIIIITIIKVFFCYTKVTCQLKYSLLVHKFKVGKEYRYYNQHVILV